MQDLLAALQMFKQGVTEAATASAINDAHAQVQQIRTNIQGQAEQRQAFQNLSNDVALRLTGVGANGQQIQSAFQAIAPQNFGSAEQLQLEGQLSGNKFYQQQADSIIGQRDAKKNAEMERRHQMDLEKIREQAKLSNKGTQAQSLREGELERIMAAQNTLQSGLDLQRMVSGKNGSSLVGYGDYSMLGEALSTDQASFGSKFRGFQSRFIKEITGAGVSVQEAERILGTLPDPQYNTAETFEAKMQTFNAEVQQAIENRMNTLEAAGKDVSGIRANFENTIKPKENKYNKYRR